MGQRARKGVLGVLSLVLSMGVMGAGCEKDPPKPPETNSDIWDKVDLTQKPPAQQSQVVSTSNQDCPPFPPLPERCPRITPDDEKRLAELAITMKFRLSEFMKSFELEKRDPIRNRGLQVIIFEKNGDNGKADIQYCRDALGAKLQGEGYFSNEPLAAAALQEAAILTLAENTTRLKQAVGIQTTSDLQLNPGAPTVPGVVLPGGSSVNSVVNLQKTSASPTSSPPAATSGGGLPGQHKTQ